MPLNATVVVLGMVTLDDATKIGSFLFVPCSLGLSRPVQLVQPLVLS
jgi:hypothetical protein